MKKLFYIQQPHVFYNSDFKLRNQIFFSQISEFKVTILRKNQ